MSILKNIGELATVNPKSGEVVKISDAFLQWKNEKIIAFGKMKNVPKDSEIFDADGLLVTAGLIDAHTHPVFSGSRANEFYLRNSGVPYMKIAQKGGGIRASVRMLRESSDAEIRIQVQKNLDGFIAHGTTTIEGKSGYGLSVKDEIRSLEILNDVAKNHPLDVIPTFLGAHEVPDEYRENRDEYIRIVCEEMIPKVAENGLAEYCDVFCEEGVFSVAESRKIFETAKKYGLKIRFHAEEFVANGGAELAEEIGAHSADHLMAITDDGIQALQNGGVVPIVLPGTTFFLGKDSFAPVQKMLDADLPVALATDFNPGSSFTQNLQLIMTIGCVQFGFSAEQALKSVTYNAAKSLHREHQIGCLAPKFQADFVVWDVSDLDELPYLFGTNHAKTVFKSGSKMERRFSG